MIAGWICPGSGANLARQQELVLKPIVSKVLPSIKVNFPEFLAL